MLFYPEFSFLLYIKLERIADQLFSKWGEQHVTKHVMILILHVMNIILSFFDTFGSYRHFVLLICGINYHTFYCIARSRSSFVFTVERKNMG